MAMTPYGMMAQPQLVKDDSLITEVLPIGS